MGAAAAFVAHAIDVRVSHLALSLSRILYHAALLWLVLDMWCSQETAFAHDREAAALLLPLALVVNALLILGQWTQPCLILNAVLLRVIFALCLDPYSADEVAENFSVLLILSPAPRCLSLDSLRSGRFQPMKSVARPFVLVILTALALIYADGLRHKLASTVWRQGSAFWLGAALPHFSTGLMPEWAEIGWLMRATTYGALTYEALFPLIIVRRLRWVFAGFGLLLHAGSDVFMALPQFALLMTSLVSFFVPWERLLPANAVGPHDQLPSHSHKASVLFAYGLVGLMLAGQLRLNLQPGRPRNLLCRALGLHPRIIFVDWHFGLRGPLVRFSAIGDKGELPIPSFDPLGYPTIHDRYWKLFAFTARISGRWQEPATRYVRGWFERSGLEAVQIRAYCREVGPLTLSLDFAADDEERLRPWVQCGELSLPGSGRFDGLALGQPR